MPSNGLIDTSSVLELAQQLSGQVYQRFVEAQERERNRIAKELHDGPMQMLVALTSRLRESQDLAPELTDLCTTAYKQLQDISTIERSEIVTCLGLACAFEAFAGEISRNFLIEVIAENNLTPQYKHFDTDLEIALFRIGQQAVYNAIRHGRAKRIEIELIEVDNAELRLKVSDNGRGFNVLNPGQIRLLPLDGHYGLADMLVRAEAFDGDFWIESSPGEGTCIKVCLPALSNGQEVANA